MIGDAVDTQSIAQVLELLLTKLDFQALASLAMVLITIALVVVTWRYANSTKRMADVMAQDYETRTSPLFDVWVESAKHARIAGQNQINIRLRISQHGTMKFKIDRVKLYWWHGDDRAGGESKECDEKLKGETVTDSGITPTLILLEKEAMLGQELTSAELRACLWMQVEIEASNALEKRGTRQTQKFQFKGS